VNLPILHLSACVLLVMSNVTDNDLVDHQ
jgi:hypothetical protein